MTRFITRAGIILSIPLRMPEVIQGTLMSVALTVVSEYTETIHCIRLFVNFTTGQVAFRNDMPLKSKISYMRSNRPLASDSASSAVSSISSSDW